MQICKFRKLNDAIVLDCKRALDAFVMLQARHTREETIPEPGLCEPTTEQLPSSPGSVRKCKLVADSEGQKCSMVVDKDEVTTVDHMFLH